MSNPNEKKIDDKLLQQVVKEAKDFVKPNPNPESFKYPGRKKRT
ncbi:hypothetical protein AAGG74_16260 [Bacillus mexicanus]